jgi:hypothetical protein
MKKMFLTLLAVLGLASLASAQQYAPATLISSYIVGASQTSNCTPALVIPMQRYNEIGLQFKVQLAGTGTDAVTYTFAKSVDGVNYDTTGMTVSFAHTGATAKYYTTNLTVGACGYLKLVSIQNGDTGDVQTNTVKYVFKPQRKD